MLKKLCIFFIILCSINSYSQEIEDEGDSGVVYKYKQQEVFDFGELSIDGQIITPGDLSVKFKDRKNFSKEFQNRDNFDKEVMEDLEDIR